MERKRKGFGVALILLGGLMLLGLAGCGKKDTRELTAYVETAGGGDTGGHRSMEIWLYDGEAYVTKEKVEWHYEDPVAEEYKIDKAVLTEIGEIYFKYKMEKWEGISFSNVEVCDGETYGYSFSLADGSNVRFSSQYYGNKYSKKLSEISAVTDKYFESAERIPGLKITDFNQTDYIGKNYPEDGVIKLVVFNYAKHKVYFRVANGTDDSVSYAKEAVLYNADGEKIAERESDYLVEVDEHSSEDFSLATNGFLEAGTYKIVVGDLESEFVIE